MLLQKIFALFLILSFSSYGAFAQEAVTQGTSAQDKCATPQPSEILECFINLRDDSFKYSEVSQEQLETIRVKNYVFHSQKWPITADDNIPTTTWKHRLVLYIPKVVEHNQVLLYVGGGYVRNDKGEEQKKDAKEKLDFVQIANTNKAIVAYLQDVPNQFLMIDGAAKKEDQIMAFTYKKFMADPVKNAYLAGHLPMTKAVVKAMDVVQDVLNREHQMQASHFVLAGASKRGWAVWLTALIDERVGAIIPIVIDVLNTQKSIQHICSLYEGGCPYALKDYVAERITEHLDTEAFAQLMKVEDPFSYLDAGYPPRYRERMAIPKLLINASGDDFFTPDSSQWYFKQLPGSNNYIRYLPNSMHYFAGSMIVESTGSLGRINDAVNNYFGFLLHKQTLPQVTWSFAPHSISISTSHKPKSAKLWVAHNEKARDFRFMNSYTTLHKLIKLIFAFFSLEVCDTCYIEHPLTVECEKNCAKSIDLPSFSQGWQASFVELNYDINGKDFTVTTEVKIEAGAPLTQP